MKSHLRKFVIFSCFMAMLFWAQPARSLSEVSVILTNPSVGATTSVTVSFTVDGGIQWTSDGGIAVVFPTSFNLDNVEFADVSAVQGLDGGFASTVVGSIIAGGNILNNGDPGVLTFRDGTGQNVSDTDCKLRIDNVINPLTEGLTDTFLVVITGSGSTPLDSETAPGVVISEPLALGGSSNHSKFCLLNDLEKGPLAVLGFMFLLTALGARTRLKAA